MPQMFVRGVTCLVPMEEAPFASGEELRRLLAEARDLMPGELFDGSEPRRWLFRTPPAGGAQQAWWNDADADVVKL